MRRILATGALICLATPAIAQTTFTANLTNSQEPGVVAPTTSTGAPRPVSFGTGTFVLNDTQTALTYTIDVFNIDVTGTQTADTFDNLLAAHIHAPAAPGTNAGVVFGFFGAPLNDNNPNDFTLTPFASGVGGTFTGKWDALEGNNTTLALQLANLFSGLSYVNFHTVQFPGGEIRGQILPVPEPATWATMLLGFGAIGVAVRRKRRALAFQA